MKSVATVHHQHQVAFLDVPLAQVAPLRLHVSIHIDGVLGHLSLENYLIYLLLNKASSQL